MVLKMKYKSNFSLMQKRSKLINSSYAYYITVVRVWALLASIVVFTRVFAVFVDKPNIDAGFHWTNRNVNNVNKHKYDTKCFNFVFVYF